MVPGQFGRVIGRIEPIEEHYEFVDKVTGGNIPREFIPSVDAGFKSMLDKGRLIGFPVMGLKVILDDGKAHSVDSSQIAFEEAARGAFREVYQRAKPTILEPIMAVSVEGPSEFQGTIVGTLMQRRGMISGTTDEHGTVTIDADVPLAEMFAYTNTLRSSTQGKAEFTMEFARYAPVPAQVKEDLIRKYNEEQEAKKKKK